MCALAAVLKSASEFGEVFNFDMGMVFLEPSSGFPGEAIPAAHVGSQQRGHCAPMPRAAAQMGTAGC